MKTNKLSPKTKKILQFSIILVLMSFLIGWFVFFKPNVEEPTLKNDKVYIEESTLYVFEDTYSLNFPNKISMHYPYLLVAEPNSQKTHIYNLKEKRLEKDIADILLDYTNGSILKNDGRSSYFNDKSLDILCEKGFIKNETEILCLTKINPNTVENKLISMNVETLKKDDIYVSKDIITDFSFINGVTYIGEINLHTKKGYLIIGKEKIEVPSIINMIYEMEGKPYFMSLRGALNDESSLFLINENYSVINMHSLQILK